MPQLSHGWSSLHWRKKKGERFLIIPGDLNIPYEIVDGVMHVETVQSTLIVNAFEKAFAEGFKKLEQLIRNETDADAVINTSVQLVLYTAKSRSGEMGQVVIFGTLVKYK